MHRRVAALRSRFLAQAHKRRSDQRLQFRFALNGQLVAHAPDGFHQRAAIATAVQLPQIGKPDRCGSSCFRRFQSDTRCVFHQDFVRCFQFTAPQHLFQECPHVPGRHAPCFVRGEHFLFVFFRHLLPEFLVQQFRVRLHGEPRLGHHLFLRRKDFAQRFDFRVHAVQQLLHRIHAQLAALVTVQREANGHMLCQLEKHRFVGFGIGSLRRQSRQRLLQRVLRAHGHGAQTRLERWHVHA